MTQLNYPSAYAIGACLPCNHLFLVGPASVDCPLCGRPPAYTLPFTAVALSAHPEPVEGSTPAPPAAPPTLIGVTCPHCDGNVQLSITDSEIAVIPPPPQPPPTAEEEPTAHVEAPWDQPPPLTPPPELVESARPGPMAETS
jgi:hypothetical protein